MDFQTGRAVLLAVAALAAAGFGGALWRTADVRTRQGRYRQTLRERLGASGADGPGGTAKADMVERVLRFARRLQHRMAGSSFKGLSPPFAARAFPAALVRSAGMEGQLTPAAYGEARVRLALLAAAAGGLAGLMASAELAAILGLGGAIVGWKALPWALGRRSKRRAQEMERHLSEMLDVMALGLRSGLSFERSLELYVGHFATLLAASFSMAHRQWTCGLASREEALRAVAASYASPLLDRVVENVIRSLRFGSSLAGNLEDAAREARTGYRARKQEQVAKAPVKMMVPTGMLILPAMLMLVLGPVLMELINGF